MKWFLVIAGACVISASAVSSFAGSACCAAGKATSEQYACTQALSGLELSAEQQAKIAEIEAACKAEGMTAEACAKSRDQIRAVLTDEQRAQFDANWNKKSKKDGSCG